MNKAISRTTTQVANNKYKVYQKSAPLFYKDINGDLKDIELSWTKDGNKYVSNKNICFTEIDPDNKSIKVKADGGKDISIDFTISKISFDGNDSDIDLTEVSCIDNKADTNDVLFLLKNSRVMQLFKTPNKFKNFRIEYTISLNNCSIINKFNTENYQFTNNDTFEIIDLGERDGTWIFESNGTDALEDDFVNNKGIPHIDFYISKITDDFILQSSQYTEDEEFNSNLSNYNSCKIGWEGSSMYLKDTIICYFKLQNIDNAEDVIISNICSMYDLTTIYEDNVNGRYFIDSNNKKVGSFSYDDKGRFFVFFNTKDIPSKIKDMFKRKTFNDVGYIDKTLDDFKSDINKMFSYKYKPIIEDTSYYMGYKGDYVIQVANTPFIIKRPSLFDKDMNLIGFCSHSMKKNDNNTLTYTKYFKDNLSRLDNSIVKYIDVDLQLDEEVLSLYQRRLVEGGVLPTSSKNSTTFGEWRNIENSSRSRTDDYYIGGGYLTDAVKYIIQDHCTKTKTTSSGYGVTTTTWTSTWIFGCSKFHFDTSTITDTVTDSSFKFYGKYQNQSTGAVVGDAIADRPLTMIALKSSGIEDPSEGVNNANNYYTSADWNDFDGVSMDGTTEDIWDSSDVTEYGTSCDMKQGTEDTYALGKEYNTFNSAFFTDVKDNDDVYIYFMDKDLLYDNDFAITEGLAVDTSNSSSAFRNMICQGADHTTVANRPYLEVTTGTVVTPTDNATFFGANF